jgi:ribosomal protein S21
VVTIVRKKPGDSEDRLIAEFRKKIQANKVLTEIREREFYKPPSTKRKERLAELRRRRVRR